MSFTYLWTQSSSPSWLLGSLGSQNKVQFIVKPAGPSRQFGWVGPGGRGKSSAPKNIPSQVFKAAGVNTLWNLEDPLFSASLVFPPPLSAPRNDLENFSKEEEEEVNIRDGELQTNALLASSSA